MAFKYFITPFNFGSPVWTEIELQNYQYNTGESESWLRSYWATGFPYSSYALEQYHGISIPVTIPDIIDFHWQPDIHNAQAGSVGATISKLATTFDAYDTGLLAVPLGEYKTMVVGPLASPTQAEYDGFAKYVRWELAEPVIPDGLVPTDFAWNIIFQLAGFPYGRPTETPPATAPIAANYPALAALFDDALLNQLTAVVSTYQKIPTINESWQFNYLMAAQLIEYLVSAGYAKDGRDVDVAGASMGDLAMTFAPAESSVAHHLRQAQILRAQAARF